MLNIPHSVSRGMQKAGCKDRRDLRSIDVRDCVMLQLAEKFCMAFASAFQPHRNNDQSIDRGGSSGSLIVGIFLLR
jgi:hypothetical protein